MTIFIGADHRGFKQKNEIYKLLLKLGYNVIDNGAHNYDEDDDYPIFAFKVAEGVVLKKGSKGILICGSGVGMCIAANKVKGIRAVFANNAKIAKKSRDDNDSNILCLSASDLTLNQNIIIIKDWLKSTYSNEKRHKRRLKSILTYEMK